MSFRVILVHGFNGSYRDMEFLKENLENYGYSVENLNFPLTFPEINHSVSILKEYLLDLKGSGLTEKEEIILIGYGLGGRVIEICLKDEELKGVVDKIILIATPLKDSVIHRRVKRIFPLLDRIFKPLRILKKKYEFKIDDNIEVGVIIGTEGYGVFQKWLGEYNDGVLSMKECRYNKAKDSLTIPLIHKEIHKKIGVVRYINNFIAKGFFRK